MRALVGVAVMLGCGSSHDPPPPAPAPALPVAPPRDAAPLQAPAPPPLTFAVMSDLHLANPKAEVVKATVAALVALHPRFVVITGDFTNGTAKEGPPRAAWPLVTALLEPLRVAKIPVLPVAGNHDSYTAAERARYAGAFGDLSTWAAPLVITSTGTHTLDRAPFSYSVDVDGIHLALVHVVAQALDREVATWLAADLAAAHGARLRLAFEHVPYASIIQGPNAVFGAQYGKLLEAGHVDALIAGHEHLVWDEDVALPAGGTLHEVLVGCTSGFYNYGPSPVSLKRAGCAPIVKPGAVEPLRCTMPHGGGAFELARGRKHRLIQHARATFTLITIDGTAVTAKPMTLDGEGRPVAFYL